MTQSTLKRLAVLSMLCDHIAKVVLSTGLLRPMLGAMGNLLLMTVLVVIGRLAFPIFAWFVAEGCRKTGNFPRYLGRMALFAVLSEVPFQLCFYRAADYGLRIACHNVIFTLLLAALGIYAAKVLMERGISKPAAALLPGVLATALGWVLKTDYNAWGVVLVLMLYYLPEDKTRLVMLGAWMTLFTLVWHGWNGQEFLWIHRSGYGLLLHWIGGMFSVPLLATYNGEKGCGSKWLFYVFYPGHLWLIYGIHCLI